MVKRAIGLILCFCVIGLPLAYGQALPLSLTDGDHSCVHEDGDSCCRSWQCSAGCCCGHKVADGIGQCVCQGAPLAVFLPGLSIIDPTPLKDRVLATSIEHIYHPQAINAANLPHPEHYMAEGVLLQTCCFRL